MSLELSKIKISNYKSIDDISLDVKKFDNSYTTIFVGKNETGKSNLLKALQLAECPDVGVKFEDFKNAQNDKAEYIDAYFTYKFNGTEGQDLLKARLNAPLSFVDSIKINAIQQNTYLEKEAQKFVTTYDVLYEKIPDDFLNKYSFEKLEITSEGENFLYEIKLTSEINIDSEEIENPDTSSDVQVSSYKPLDKKTFEEILDNIFETEIDACKLEVSKWQHSKEYLITETIDLNSFKSNSEVCYPLKNIFTLAGYSTQQQISDKIDSLSGSIKNINKLEKQLEDTLSEYVDKVWKECNIIFKIKIQNNLMLDVFIYDKTDKDNSYTMSDRSEGFKQFASLILSISAANETDTLRNKIILIDEPEVHMHPSGIRYMRDELLRIGQNNYVFVATHSQFMIDTKNKERHYIITKPNNNTSIKVWDSTRDLADDEILRQAFGINVLNDLLSPYRILVEGFSDCQIFIKALNVLKKNHCITITNGTGANIIAVASMLKMYNVPVLTLVDADTAGEKYKKEIIKIGNSFNDTSVKTIRDLVSEIIEKGTIEDTLKPEFVIKNMKDSVKGILPNETFAFEYTGEKAILEEFKIYLSSHDKKEVEAIFELVKTKIAENFNPNSTNLKNNHPKLLALCNKILEHFEIS